MGGPSIPEHLKRTPREIFDEEQKFLKEKEAEDRISEIKSAQRKRSRASFTAPGRRATVLTQRPGKTVLTG